MRLFALRIAAALSALVTTTAAAQQKHTSPLSTLEPESVVEGFRTKALYTDAADKVIGARFTHEKTGFTLDVIRQQSVPQAHIWVNTFPMNDRGEPHTQEHLLVGKGSRGRALGTLEQASLATSTAFTEQTRTAYAFNTTAGAHAFYTLMDAELAALLQPDFTDEETRREVRNFGVTDDPATKTLGLEEKGSVYNEMTSTTAGSFSRMYSDMLHMMWGDNNPLSRNAGGTPEGIRGLGAADIRAFHASHYYAANMGAIVAMPESVPLAELLKNIGNSVTKYDRTPASKSPVTSMSELPKPAGATEGTIHIVGFPNRNAQQPGNIQLGWAPTRKIGVNDETLLDLFMSTFAGDPTTNLYKLFVDSKTKSVDLGVRSVGYFTNNEPGYPIYLTLGNVDAKNVTEAQIALARSAILAELARVAAFPDSSKELDEFNARARSRTLSDKRSLSKFVNSPPGFGFRNTGGGWNAQLDLVNEQPGFRKSLVLTPAMHYVDSVASLRTNAWRTLLPQWGLMSAPYAVGVRPDPALIDKEDAERKARASAEIARLKAQYGASDDQDAIRRYRADYDRNSSELQRLASAVPRTRLVADLPMTNDDQLQYKTERVRGVPVVSSTFESMTSSTIGLALKTDNVADDELVYLAALPTLMTRVGIVRDGVPMSYEMMSERQRREILALGASFSSNVNTGRVEVVVRGSGNDQPESVKALGWMKDVLVAPDWRAENLPRIRDVIDQSLAGLRQTQQGPPESWVQSVASAYRQQDNPRYLAAASFLTRQNLYLRLRWLFKDPGSPAQQTAVGNWVKELAGAARGHSRSELLALTKAVGDTTAAMPAAAEHQALVRSARALPAGARALAADLARDLTQVITDIPDESLAQDWSYIVNQLHDDLLVAPTSALGSLNAVRERLLTTANARGFVTSSSATRKNIAPALESLLGVLHQLPAAAASRRPGGSRVVDARLMARSGATSKPTFVGLLDQNMQGGVFLNSAPLASYKDTSRRALTRFLAAKLYGGGGAHSVFSQTIAAGLAYSNGIGSGAASGRLSYYAERTPELPQTLKFVVERLKASPHDTALVDYATALVFNETRAGGDFESRGESMAADLADGILPPAVRAFRSRILALRKSNPRLGQAMYAQMDSVYAEVLPGYTPGMPNVPGAVYFTIGSEKQQDAYDKYLKASVAPDAALVRLYPRDFWVVRPSVTP